MVREEDAQPLAHPHTTQTVTSSALGRGREKTNEILNVEVGGRGQRRETDRQRGYSCWVW